MVPTDLHEFLVVSVEASASFIGLLFVGLSVVSEKIAANQTLVDHDHLQVQRAQNAYIALINIFFVSLIGLVPDTNIGPVSLAMAILGLVSCWRLRKLRNISTLVLSVLVYIGEVIFGIYTLNRGHQLLNLGILQLLFIALFILGLLSAWRLTGIRQH